MLVQCIVANIDQINIKMPFLRLFPKCCSPSLAETSPETASKHEFSFCAHRLVIDKARNQFHCNGSGLHIDLLDELCDRRDHRLFAA